MILRYIKGKFSNQHKITVGADLFSNEVAYNDNQYILQIWDTAGQERFQSIGSAFYRGSDACILVFDITNEKSFTNLENWKREFINQGGVKDPETFPFIVLANKCDKEDERVVDLNTLEEYCKDNGGMPFFETSAKDDLQVSEAFLETVKLAADQHEEEDVYIPPSIVIKPKQQGNRNNQTGCC